MPPRSFGVADVPHPLVEDMAQVVAPDFALRIGTEADPKKRFPVWLFRPDAFATLGVNQVRWYTLEIPADYGSALTCWIWWTAPVDDTGNVVWAVRSYQLQHGDPIAGEAVAAVDVNPEPANAGGAAGDLMASLIILTPIFLPNTVCIAGVYRDTEDVADTHPDTAEVLSISFRYTA